MSRPDEEEAERTAKETAAALQKAVDRKVAAVNPKTLPAQPGEAQYIKYTPSSAGPAHASGAGARIIKMQDMPIDPLEPPKFRWAMESLLGACVLGVGGESCPGVCAWERDGRQARNAPLAAATDVQARRCVWDPRAVLPAC